MKSFETMSFDADALNNIINIRMKSMEIGYIEGILLHT